MSEPESAAASGSAFQAAALAGLWPGLGRTRAALLEAAGIVGPADVTVARLSTLAGVTAAQAQRLVGAFETAAPAYAVAELLAPARLPVRWALRLVALLGPAAAEVLRTDPWRLLDLPEARLAEADALARRWDVTPDERRGRAVVGHVLERAAADGHTVVPVPVVLAEVHREGVADPRTAVQAALDEDRISAHAPEGSEEVLGLVRLEVAEEAIAEGLARLVSEARPWGDAAAARAVTGELDAVQASAVGGVVTSGVVLLTGGPGTGKSRTVAAVVALARARGKRVALAAPTGRAAKRLEEICGEPATTLHRLLQAQGTTGEFLRGAQWPLDADLVVVDETSMLDVPLAAAMVEAVPDGAHLLLVGDPAQLPSIGPGRVLADLVDSGRLPVVELTTLYRQAEGGAIARLATSIRSGELPESPTSADREVVVVPGRTSAEAAHRVVQLVTDSIPRTFGLTADEIQVVTPVHRGPAGTVALNQALKARLNPGDGETSGFDVGDRVVATANHLGDGEGGFANGEVGTVTGRADGGLLVTFAGGPVTVPAKALGDLRHGWAVTVHRAQGSEWPAVVAVLPGESGRLLSRPLVYTAFTRAQRHLSVVHAVGPALAHAVRDVRGRPRLTRLGALLVDALDAVEG